MTLSLTMIDLQNGLGATASVVGSDPGSVNKIYVQQVTGGTNPGSGAWFLAGSITSDGSVGLSLVPAYYWGYCAATVSGSPALSNLVYFAVTQSALAVMARMQNAIVATIQTLTMANNPNANIYAQLQPNWDAMQVPCVFVTYLEEQEETKSSLAGRDDIGYPFRVQAIDRASVDYTPSLNGYLLWRQQLMRKFRQQQFASVPESLINIVKPLKVIEPKNNQMQLMSVPFRLICWSREVRG